jgi:hypothetical protein
MPAAKGSARTPLGPICLIMHLTLACQYIYRKRVPLQSVCLALKCLLLDRWGKLIAILTSNVDLNELSLGSFRGKYCYPSSRFIEIFFYEVGFFHIFNLKVRNYTVSFTQRRRILICKVPALSSQKTVL